MTDHHQYQHWGLREDDVLVAIHDTKKDDGHTYRCPFCNQLYTPKRGEHNKWHFAHKVNNPEKCSYDRYLHSLAEQRILEWYKNSPIVRFQLQNVHRCSDFGHCKWQKNDCHWKGRTEPYNLKDYFDVIELEKKNCIEQEYFIADILLSDKNDAYLPILIEIWVNNESSEKKHFSGLQIIEISIESEEDIDKLVSGDLLSPALNDTMPKGHRPFLTFYGFESEDTLHDCQLVPLYKLVAYENGNVAISTCNCKSYNERVGTLELTKPFPADKVDQQFVQRTLYAKAIEIGVLNRHCCVMCEFFFDCSHCGQVCEKYKTTEKSYPFYREKFTQYPFDIWQLNKTTDNQ
ncbi:MAG: hypothetical protein J6T19_01655 [Paludibacteraceae bacterium]|nr:hypothetical protein [Paludibacteraceae bacterium]